MSAFLFLSPLLSLSLSDPLSLSPSTSPSSPSLFSNRTSIKDGADAEGSASVLERQEKLSAVSNATATATRSPAVLARELNESLRSFHSGLLRGTGDKGAGGGLAGAASGETEDGQTDIVSSASSLALR